MKLDILWYLQLFYLTILEKRILRDRLCNEDKLLNPSQDLFQIINTKIY